MKYLQDICVCLMILLSGSVRCYLEYSPIFVPLLFLLGIVLFYTNRKTYNSHNTLLFLFLLVIPLINMFFINPHMESNLPYICVLFIICGFLIISSFDFESFRTTWIKYIKWLCSISIVVQLLHDYMGLPPNGMDVRGCATTLYFFNCDWGDHRLSSIYWEPGQFQIVLIYTLALFTDDLANWTDKKKWIKQFGVIIIALIMTISTTGYLSFMILLSGLLFSSRSNPSKKTLSLKLVIPILIVMVGLWQSDAIQEKIKQREDPSERTSAATRTMDNIALFSVTMDSPIVGYGIDTVEQNKKKREYGSVDSSNGWLYASSAFGVIYVGFILMIMYRRLVRMPRGFPPFIIWLALVVSQCNEYIMFFPYLYLYIFNFKKKVFV